jgi:S1-C subfamily serine protease
LHHYGSLIETDAVLDRGTSGGPLLNLQGQMIGLTTTYSPSMEEGAVAGLAIPVDQAFKDALAKLKTGRKAEFGFLGVATQPPEYVDAPSQPRGAIVGRVELGTPAASLDLHEYEDRSRNDAFDVITHVDDEEVADANELIMLLGRLPAERRVRLTVEQHDLRRAAKARVRTLEVTLSKKRIETPRPIYATIVDPIWRGLTVEYATATPSFFDRPGSRDEAGAVGLLEVERNSPAWKAGLRPGDFITHVADKRVATPAQFYAAVEGKAGAVKVRMTEAVGDSLTVVIPAP